MEEEAVAITKAEFNLRPLLPSPPKRPPPAAIVAIGGGGGDLLSNLPLMTPGVNALKSAAK